jgi:hypothetical protein
MPKDQGARIVICSKHGLPYDASKRGGCARCIREWERQKAPGPGERKGGFPTSITLLGLLLLAAGVYVLLTRPEDAGSGTTAPGTATPGPSAPGVAAPPPVTTAADETARQALDEILGEIPDLIQDGRNDAEVLLADAADADRLKDDWDFWSADWNGRVRQLTEKLPGRRPDSEDQLALALVYQDVAKALEELRAIPASTVDGLPDAVAVRERFQAADKALQQARLHRSQVNP